jgi:hypothetical protein
MSLAQQLAYIESEKELSRSDPYIMSLNILLTELSVKYNEPKDTIAEWTQKCQAVLKIKHYHQTSLQLMKGINNTKKVKGVNYRDALTLYSYLLTKDSN